MNVQSFASAQAALHFRTRERQVARLCGPLGRLERPARSLAPILRHRDDRSE